MAATAAVQLHLSLQVDEAWKLASEAKGGSGANCERVRLWGSRVGRSRRWQVGVEDGTCYVESREARTLESRKFLKLLRQPLILFEFMILCI